MSKEEIGSIHEGFDANEEEEFKAMLIPDEAGAGAGSDEEAATAAAKAASEEASKAGGDEATAEELAIELAKKQAEEAAASDKTVPLEALHESRMETREIRNQMMDVQRQLGTMMGLKDELQALRQKDVKDEKAELIAAEDKLFEDDPIAALQAKVTRLQGEQDAVTASKTEADETTVATQKKMEENQAAMVTFQNEVKAKVAEFEVENPDYPDAFKFLMERRMKDFAALGINDPMEQQKNFDIETMAMANNALQRGVNPAKAAYELAKNWGYTKAAAPGEGNDDKNGGDEATKAAAELATKKKALQDQIAALEKGQAASSTLAGAGGGAPESGPSLTDIEQMSDPEFDKLWDSMENSSIY